jgi:hypothetical protein
VASEYKKNASKFSQRFVAKTTKNALVPLRSHPIAR